MQNQHLRLLALSFLLLLPLLIVRANPVETGLVLSHPAGHHPTTLHLTLTATTPILFTQDGSEPTPANAQIYTTPIRLSAPAGYIIRARLQHPNGQLGDITNATYLIGLDTTLPTVSLITDPAHLWDKASGIYTNPLQKGRDWERPVHIEFFDTPHPTPHTPHTTFVAPAGLRIHGGFTRTYDKKSLRLYFRSDYGLNTLQHPLFPGDDALSVHDRLVLHGGGQDSAQDPTNWTLLRNQLTAQLAFDMGLPATRSRPVLLLLNGEVWGIYQLRERLDARWLDSQLGIPQADMLDAPEELDGFGNTVSGDRQHWDNLVVYLETHDLSDPAGYAYVTTQMDIPNFIDYTILQLYSANADWPQNNVNQFRPRTQGGRWQWVVWDNDFSYGLTPYSTADMDMIAQALRLDSANWETRRDTLLLRVLLDNPTFVAQLLARTDELLATVLAPANVIRHIDTLSAELAPDMHYETGRWGSATSWLANVESLRGFAVARPGHLHQHLQDYLTE